MLIIFLSNGDDGMVGSSSDCETPSAQPKRRIAIVYHFFAHYRRAIMTALLRTRHDVLLVADTVDPRNVLNKGGAEVKGWLPDDPKSFLEAKCRWLPGRLMWQSGLIRLALRNDLDVIVFLGDPHYPATWLAAAIARLRGKRVLFWTIGWYHAEPRARLVLKRLYYKIAHGLLLYGHFAKTIAIREHFAPERLYVVYNSLDDEPQKQQSQTQVTEQTVRQWRSELFERPDLPVVICVSRLQTKRRLDLLVDAAKILKRRGHEVNLLFVGAGPEQDNLQRMAEAQGVALCFYGPCYDQQRLAELIMSANVTVAPGMVGLLGIQSLTFGTPVVTHGDPWNQSPEFEVVIPGVNGDYFEHGDTEDLADCIQRWTQTTGVSESLRRKCSEMVERFYNAQFQSRVIMRAAEGKPADDLFWMKPEN